jgi:hypothetical protein
VSAGCTIKEGKKRKHDTNAFDKFSHKPLPTRDYAVPKKIITMNEPPRRKQRGILEYVGFLHIAASGGELYPERLNIYLNASSISTIFF